MNLFNDIALFLQSTMDTPAAYGWFHLLSIVLIASLAIFMAVKFKNADDKANKKILIIFAVIMLVLEVYKQINYVWYNAGTNVWDYSWYAFPFQFCSVPMYIMLLAGLIKKGKFQERLFAFLGTYALFAGLAVMLYPGDVFVSMIGINIQTMMHHGFMFVVGVYMLASGRAPIKQDTIIKSLPVFAVLALMALGMNYMAVWVGLTATHTFNMFFISPFFGCTLPVLSIVFDTLPYIAFLLVYILGFTFVGYLMLVIAMGIKQLYNLIIKREQLEKK
jgi:hypothetical protein